MYIYKGACVDVPRCGYTLLRIWLWIYVDICVRYVVHVHVADVYFEKLKGGGI